MYFDDNSNTPQCALAPQPAATLGDLGGPLESIAKSLGMSTSGLIVVGLGGLALGWAANSLFTGARRKIRRGRLQARRRAREAREKIVSIASTPVPAWQTALLVLAAGGAIFLVMKLMNTGKAKA